MPYNNRHQTPYRYSVLARCVAWANIFVQVLFPLTAAFSPVMTAHAQHLPQLVFDISSRPYTLKQGESAQSLADKLGLSRRTASP